MNRRGKIIVSITGIILVSLFLIALTYGYYITKIKGNSNSKSITATTADLSLVYGDGNGIIEPTNTILPGDTIASKTFTVTNDGKGTVNDYVVVLENVYNELTRPQDLVYKVECTSSDDKTCNGVSTETQFPSGKGSVDAGEGFGIVVTNSIDKDVVHTYTITLKYLNQDADQSVDMNKTIQGKINIKDGNEINPYKSQDGTLANAIINNAVNLTSEQKSLGYAEFRTTPLTKIAQDISSRILYFDNGVGTEATKNYIITKTLSETDASQYYFTYGDTYTYKSRYTITNKDGSDLQAALLSTGYETLKEKYIVSYSGSTSSTAVSGSNKHSIYYCLNATATTIEYIELNGGMFANERYITYGDSYEINIYTGKYTLKNPKVVKYNEGYNNVLVGKYVANLNGSVTQGVKSTTDQSKMYLITENSTKNTVAYKQVGYKTGIENVENTLSIANDDLGITYYYRGAVENNYLEFNNMCFRIVRIEGDGSVKITLAAQKKCSEITDSDTGTAFVGYGNYGYINDYLTNSSGQTTSSKKKIADYENTSNRTTSMRYILESWLTNNGIDTNKLKQDNWCLGNTTDIYNNSGTLLTTSKNDLMDNGTKFFYSSFVRFWGKGQTRNATYNCNGENDKNFSSYIGTLTADEVIYAGSKVNVGNDLHYLCKNAKTNWWYTLTPSSSTDAATSDNVFKVSTAGGLGDYWSVADSHNIRPALTLKSGTKISSGDGTKENPYIVS